MRRWFYLTEGNETWRDELSMRFDIWLNHLCTRRLRGHHWRYQSEDDLGIFGGPHLRCWLCGTSQSLPLPPTTHATSASTNATATMTWVP